MNNNIILTTVFSGFNYGSSLQAFAGKKIIQSLGYDCEIIKLKSFVKGRDIRLNKLMTVFIRSVIFSQKHVLDAYRASYKKVFVHGCEEMFNKFTDDYLEPIELSWHSLKKMATGAIACFSGSDQIWNSSALYVDPLYYLRFAPSYKRVAFAPSFGRDYIANYNKTKMAKWIGEYPYISIRENSGVSLIEEMTGKKVQHLVDPTLVIKSEQWEKFLGIEKHKSHNYILAYFLDEPSDLARHQLLKLKNEMGCEVVSIPYVFKNMEYSDASVAAGPKEFVSLIANARLVCTDSFHGTAFSLNMHTPFYTFEREYGAANKQSERILSILRMVNMMERYQPHDAEPPTDDIDFNYSDLVLDKERDKVYKYIKDAISGILNHEK